MPQDGDVLREGIRALSEALMGYESVNAARRREIPQRSKSSLHQNANRPESGGARRRGGTRT
jgi:hypothetical protein